MNCLLCSKYISNKSNYKRHLKIIHKISNDDINEKIKKTPMLLKRFRCSSCNKDFCNQKYKNIHICKSLIINNNEDNETIEDTNEDNETIEDTNEDNDNEDSDNENNEDCDNENNEEDCDNENNEEDSDNEDNEEDSDNEDNEKKITIKNKIDVLNIGEENLYEILRDDSSYIIKAIKTLGNGYNQRQIGSKIWIDHRPEDILEVIVDGFERVYCNVDYPMNHNIYVQNKNYRKGFFIHIDNKWIKTNKLDIIIETLIRIKNALIEILTRLRTISNKYLSDQKKLQIDTQIENLQICTIFNINERPRLCIKACKKIIETLYKHKVIIGITYHNHIEITSDVYKIIDTPIIKTLHLTFKNKPN